MPKLNTLSAAKIKSGAPGKYYDGGGLVLFKREEGGAQWIFRYKIHGRAREMGLGGYPAVSLKEAREQAERYRALARGGVDPKKERERLKDESLRNMHILRDVAHEAFEARKAELKDDGKAGRWFGPLQLHILPQLGHIPIADIDQNDIKRVLSPIWHTKAATAEKALQRLHICMKHAVAMGLNADLQACEKARQLLGQSRHQVKHIPAMPWQDVPVFYGSLNEGTHCHLALRLLILTCPRSNPLRHLHVDQIDDDVWTIPGEAMKGRKGKTPDFRVPLSDEALSIITELVPRSREGFLFPNVRKGVISDATMSRYMERQGLEARPHGFRTSFRTWAAETTETPREVAEMVLSHETGSKVELAYKRTDFLEKRRVLMQRWADFVTGKSAGEVVRIAG